MTEKDDGSPLQCEICGCMIVSCWTKDKKHGLCGRCMEASPSYLFKARDEITLLKGENARLHLGLQEISNFVNGDALKESVAPLDWIKAKVKQFL